MGDPFEWQDCGQTSHAIPKSETRPPLPGDVRTLCGHSLTLSRDDFSRENRFWIRNCSTCLRAWSRYQEDQAKRAVR
jgi:hypothetical protein